MSPNKKKKVVLLHNILDLKVNCMETEICKVGFPKNSLNKYIKLIQGTKLLRSSNGISE